MMENFTQLFCDATQFEIINKNPFYFGQCFQWFAITIPIYTLLALISSLYCGLMSNSSTMRSNTLMNTHWKVLMITKVLTVILILSAICVQMTLSSIEQNMSSAFYLTASVKVITMIVHLSYILCLLKHRHLSTRGHCMVIFAFTLTLIPNIIELQTIIAISKVSNSHFIITVIILCLTVVYLCTLLPNVKNENYGDDELFINYADTSYEHMSSNQRSRSIIDNELLCEEDAHIMSKIFLYWVGPLMTKGINREINSHDDLFRLPLKLSAQNVNNTFSNTFTIASPNDDEENVHFHRQSLIKALFKCYGTEVLFIGLFKFSSDALTFGGPILLNKLVTYLDSGDRSNWGFYYAGGLFLCTLTSSIMNTLFNFYINNVTLKIRSAIITSLYRKLFSVRNDTLNSNFSTGEVLNFANTDTERIINFCPSFLQFVSLPIQFIVTLYLLYDQLGWAFISGLIFAIALLPLNRWICNKIGVLSSKMMEWKDKRIKLMSEILMGIRVIKMHSWESLFIKRINHYREEEVKYLKGRKYLDAFCVYFWATTPVLISSMVFGTYVLMGGHLTAANVFTSLALLGMLIMPLNAFPWVLNGLMEALISLKRLQKFYDLYPMDLKKHFNSDIVNNVSKIEVYGASFNPIELSDNNEIVGCRFILGPIDIMLRKGMFIGVIGRVGSGKTSLLNALIGEMRRITGKVAINETDLLNGIGIITQEPWIQNDSIRDNILFGKYFNSKKYHSVLEACALIDDLKIMPEGDHTIVGDRGVTLSGGQKSRIALARAIYQDFDIYLIDDPFSSVDIHVAEQIYSKCIIGLLAEKSKILCTHHTNFLTDADIIYVLDGGHIMAKGSPEQILKTHENKIVSQKVEKSQIKPDDNVMNENRDDVNNLPEDDEEREEGVVKLSVYMFYLKSVGLYLILLILISFILMQVTRSASDIWLSFWTSQVNDPSFNMKKYLIIFGTITLLNSVFTLIRAFIFAYGGVVSALKVHYNLLTKILMIPISFFDATAFGRIINRFSSDIYNIDDALPFTVNIFMAQMFSLLASLMITIYGIPWIALIIIPLSIPYYFIQQYYRWTSRELKRLCAVTLSPIYSHLDETLQGLVTIRVYGTVNRFIYNMYNKLDVNNKAQYAAKASQQWLNLRLQLLGVSVSTGVALLAIGLHFWSYQNVDAGLVGLALVYSLSLTGLLNGAVQSFAQTEMDMVSVERVMQYINEIEPERDSEEIIDNMLDNWPNKGVISFDKVSLRYRSDLNLALNDISFITKPREHIGIVGRTGSGKSSLFQALFRIVQIESGHILIDGVDIKKISLSTLRSQIFIIPQDPFLFSGSIRENLDPRSEHSDAEIWNSVKECHLESLVLSLGGIGAVISERGRDLSAGQRQLLCLVRALLCRTKLLCLDEATACVDSETETLIQQTIRNVFQFSTIMLIAHKVESVLNCDRIIVMDNGKIVEIGTPDRLLHDCNSKFYKNLHLSDR